MEKIGFANEYYTLWDVETTTNYNSRYGYKESVVRNYIFRKNISKSLDKVRELYPDTEIDENLRGHHSSWSCRETFEIPTEYFAFGRNQGEPIKECCDDKYLQWYWDNEINDDRRNYINEILLSRGYVFRLNKWMLKEDTQDLDSEINTILNGKFTFFADKNLTINYGDNTAEISPYIVNGIESDIYYKVIFSEYKTYVYRGYEYALPVINGQAKRIKEKTIEATDYTVLKNNGSYLLIKVNNFNIYSKK